MNRQHQQGPARLPIGAEPVPGGGATFRVWAPKRRQVEVILEGDGHTAAFKLAREDDGYFAGVIDAAGTGSHYRFLLDGEGPFPDPASRFQPDGPHGPSQVIDAAAFAWTDHAWQGIEPDRRILYEMHIGTYTPEGTWAAAARHLPALAELGVTLLEIMPVADFAGRFGWGYDGVHLFAPTRLYGEPDDFRRFVDQAHAAGLGVILDVVYNHLGPDGNYLGDFSDDYFTDRYETEWGEPFNFDGPSCEPVREFILSNVRYWIRDFHLDGFRLDATQAIFDNAESESHILTQVVHAARDAAKDRIIYLAAENEPQRSRQVRPPAAGGYGIDAVWNDDWHHSAMVALTGRTEAYYSNYRGAPQEFISAAKHGWLYQGQHYPQQRQRRGTPALDMPPSAFVTFLENHDQVANSARGERLHQRTSAGQLRAMTALLLLSPATPLLFQGQEFSASSPFLYFADHEPVLAAQVEEGRRSFLRQFPSLALPALQAVIDAPASPATFERCKLDHAERRRHAPAYALHRDLIRLRLEDRTFRTRAPGGIDGAVLSDAAFVLRFFGADGDTAADRLLLVNLGRELSYSPAPEPLLAPPTDCRWREQWSSEWAAYGGGGNVEPETADGRWHIPANCAVVLIPTSHEEA
jgi:maltooligosyltrehalose trehalohydrolase